MVAIPIAAIGVSMGKMPLNIGTTNPIPPAIFDKQINATIAGEYSVSQVNFDFNFFLKIKITVPETVITVARIACINQSVVSILLLLNY